MFKVQTSSPVGRMPRIAEFHEGSSWGQEGAVGIEVSAGWSTTDEDVKLVMVDTAEDVGRIRVMLNDGVVYDGNPEEPRTLLSTAEILNLAHDARFRGIDTEELARRIDSGTINPTTIKEA